MNLINLFGNKSKQPEPEYFLAVEIHESLIKTALWEVLEGEPSVVNVGSYESWADEESLINGVDSSLEQAVKVISGQPKRVIFGFPDSWMEEDKIHSTKIKLVSRLCKELGLEPIGAVTINRAVAHFLKKREGVPPTTILLEVYTSKVALSYIYLGEVKAIEEVAKSGDIAHDVEEGLTRMDLPNYPARFILTNGTDLQEESQQITSYPWQDKLPFKHLPKVESLPVDFSIKAVALIGGTEAVKFMGLQVNEVEESEPVSYKQVEAEKGIPVALPKDETNNLVIPDGKTPSIEDHGFSYEVVDAPENIQHESADAEFAEEIEEPRSEPIVYDLQESSTEYEEEPEEQVYSTKITPITVPKSKFRFPIVPKLPKVSLPKFKVPKIGFLLIPVALIAGFVAYLFFGKADIILHFTPQNHSQSLAVIVAQATRSTGPTLVVTSQKVSASAKESIATTGQATVGDKATGKVTLYNRSVAPISLKAGAKIASENGKNIYTLSEAVTIASKSADLLSGSEVFGKASGVAVTSTRIGAEYNMSKDSTFSVEDFSKTISYAIAETEISGGTSRAVNAVSKADQDKLIALATEKIKQITSSQVSADSPGRGSIPSSELQITKKVFDKNVGEESAQVSLELEGSLETLVYSDADLFNLVNAELKTKIPPSTVIKQDSTNIKVESLEKVDGDYKAAVSVSAALYPQIDEEKLKEFVKGKNINDIRHFFEPIKGFTEAEVKVSPPIPFVTQILPLKNIQFELVSN